MTEAIEDKEGDLSPEPQKVFIARGYIGDTIESLSARTPGSSMKQVEVVSVSGHHIFGYIFNSPPKNFERSFDVVGRVDLIDGEKTEEHIAILGKHPTIETAFDQDFDGGYFALRAWCQTMLSRLSSETGVLFSLHLSGQLVVLPILTGDCYHVFLNASPPGDRRMSNRTTICGIRLTDKSEGSFAGPIEGQGGIINDSEGEPLAQVIGRTIYLFLPTRDLWLYRRDQGQLFRIAMRHVWNALSAQEFKPLELSSVTSVDEFASAYESIRKRIDDFTERSRTRALEELEEIEDRIKSLYLFLRQLDAVKKIRQDAFPYTNNEEVYAYMSREWEQMSRLPLVDSIAYVDECMQIKTKQVYVTYGGKTYHLGSYIIRFGELQEPIIWSVDSRHPKGVLHPHIGKSMNPCFGNATMEIVRTAHEG